MAKETDMTSTAPYEGMLFERISWASIFAGAIIAVVTHLALSLLGLGIGASTIDPLSEANPMAGLGAGAGIWLAGTTLLSLFAGGWVAGKLAGPTRHRDGALHGLVTWGLATIVSALVIGSAMGSLLGRTANVVGNTVANVGQAVAPGLTEEIRSGNVDPQALKNQAEARLDAAGPEAEQRAREAGDVAARRTSQVALWTFFAMLLGALAAAIGGMAGTPAHEHLRRARVRDDYAPRGV